MKEIRVVAAVVVESGRVLIARRAPDMPHPGKWEFPGGKVEPGETDAGALARELVEELAIDVDVGRFVAESVHFQGDRAIRLVAYQCAITAGRPVAAEHDDLRWVDGSGLRGVQWAPGDVPMIDTVAALLA